MSDPNAERDARIAALEAALADLRRELARVRPRMDSMRATLRCPACGNGTVLHFRRIKDIGPEKVHALSLQKEYSAWWGLKLEAGVLEAFACRRCRLVEWHAIDLDDVVPDGTEVIELHAPVDPDPTMGPFR